MAEIDRKAIGETPPIAPEPYWPSRVTTEAGHG